MTDIDGPWFRGPEIDDGPDLYRSLATAAYAVDPMVRHYPGTRWVMDLGWYKRVRAAYGIHAPDPDDPGKWVPSPDDCLMGIFVTVEDGGGRPHLENRRYPAALHVHHG